MSYKVYEVLANTDLTEGRGSLYSVALFESEQSANVVAKRKDYAVMGVEPTGVVRVRRIYLNVDDFDGTTKEELRRKALAKLTPAEIEALGL